MRFRVTPRDGSFFELFKDAASHLVPASTLLSQILVADKPTRKQLLSQLQDAEHAADEATRRVLVKMNSTFVTPLDRDDIYDLSSGIDECVDFIEEVADLIVLYKLSEMPNGVVGMVELIQRSSELTHEAMGRLGKMQDLEEFWVEIHRLERRADKTHRKLLAKVFEDNDDPKQIMKLKEVIDILEDCMDAFDALADTVETIALKEG